MFSALLTLLTDTFELFKKGGKLSVYLVAALILQTAYWYLGSPGPQIIGAVPRSIGAAAINIGWSVLLLFVVPALLMLVFGDSFKEAGLRLGDVRFGLPATLVASLIAAVLLYTAGSFPQIQATYPWAGAWPGRSILTLLAWTMLYGLYYISFEFFFRGFMLRVLKPVWGLTAAIWVQTLISVPIHFGKPVIEVLGAIPLGIIFALLAVRSRSLLWPILFHLAIGISTDIFSLYHQGLLLP